MALIKDDKFNLFDINKEVQNIWERKYNKVIYSNENPEEALHFKVGLTIDVIDNQPHKVVAEGLVNALVDMLEGISEAEFTAYISTESVIMDILDDEPSSVMRFLSAYYTADDTANPPNIMAWLIIKGTFPEQKESRTYLMIDGEMVDARTY